MEVYQSGNMIVVKEPTANGMETTGYARSSYDWFRLENGAIRIVRKADGVIVKEVR